MSNSANSRRIAKNTGLLYVRMLLTMGISLYISRVVLDVLGIEDFGIYNVVGGIVIMFSFLNNAMSSATQRYLSFALGQKNYSELKKLFSITVNIHFFIAFVVVLLAETVGLWLLNTEINIPSDRMASANWVYQFSVLTFFVTIISVPYNAVIISHERMSIYAYVTMFEVFAKLGVVYLLQLTDFDKLAFYAVLLFIVSFIVRVFYGIYCKRNFQECTYYWVWDKKKYKELLNYASWNLFGNLAAVGFDQGINLLLNIFFGPLVNAARGIATQVGSAVTSFVSSFQMALNPQIIKSHASGNTEYMQQLISQGCRFSFYLLLIMMLPVLLNTELLLRWWLNIVPEYTVIFTKLILVHALINSISGPLMTAAQATGKIKLYQSVVGGILLLNVPISYLFLKLGYPPTVTLIVMIVISQLALFARLIILRRLINFSVSSYLKTVVLNVLAVAFVSISVAYLFTKAIVLPELSHILFSFSISFLVVFFSIYYIGLKLDERQFMITKFKLIIKSFQR